MNRDFCSECRYHKMPHYECTHFMYHWFLERHEQYGRTCPLFEKKGSENMKPIYEPKGAAKEYGDLALNIYAGCPHRCFYCYVPQVLHCDREKFHTDIRPRENIIEETRKQLEREHITGKLIHLCFTCDPYPNGVDSSATRKIIQLLKEYGNHVQILTKGNGARDLDLLDSEDWYGITLDGTETPSEYVRRTSALVNAHEVGIKTWVSFEPVVNALEVIKDISKLARVPAVDKVKIGKLNYHDSDIDWAEFGRVAEDTCIGCNLDYYIKDSLRKCMEKERNE
ncbi:MAG: radical SAM protein [Ruminiclostridium sp.]|nr:radical SAM protein [Ruminiclostridium sp.]